MKSSFWLLAVCLLAMAMTAAPARAGRVEAKERAAKKACLTGDATRGVAILVDLFIDTDDPTYIFNQGRCFEQGNRYEDAIGKFREYLRKAKDASAADKADAEKHIADCQKLLGKKEDQPPPPPPPPPPPEPTRAKVVAVPEPPPSTEATVPEPPRFTEVTVRPPVRPTDTEPSGGVNEHATAAVPASGGSGLRVAGIVTLSVGAAALVVGLVTNLKYNSMVGDMQKSYDPSVDDSAQTYHTLSMVGYGAGAACVVGGAILYYLGWRAGQVSLAPVTVAGGGGAALMGAF